MYHRIPNGITFITFMADGKDIGYVSYRPHNGQIGLIRLDEKYRGRTLGEQILHQIIPELKQKGIEELWAVTSFGHPFWSKTLNSKMNWREPAHSSVTGSGYYVKLNE